MEKEKEEFNWFYNSFAKHCAVQSSLKQNKTKKWKLKMKKIYLSLNRFLLFQLFIPWMVSVDDLLRILHHTAALQFSAKTYSNRPRPNRYFFFSFLFPNVLSRREYATRPFLFSMMMNCESDNSFCKISKEMKSEKLMRHNSTLERSPSKNGTHKFNDEYENSCCERNSSSDRVTIQHWTCRICALVCVCERKRRQVRENSLRLVFTPVDFPRRHGFSVMTGFPTEHSHACKFVCVWFGWHNTQTNRI